MLYQLSYASPLKPLENNIAAFELQEGSLCNTVEIPGLRQEQLVAGRVGTQVTGRVYWRTVHAHFVMDMGAGRAPADPSSADYIAKLYVRSRGGFKSRQVTIPSGDAETVIHDHHPAI